MFINLKTLKENPGQEITLTLNSGGVFEKKEYNGKSWNNFKYEVIQDGSVYSLDATDSLHKKLNTLEPNSTFNLSWEEFTSNEGELRNYWKVELFEQPQYENVKAPVKNGANPVKAVPQQSTPSVANPARNGMIFNNVVKLYIANNQVWTTEEFVNAYKRVEGWLEACENPATLPLATKDNEPISRDMQDIIQYDNDELPF